MRGPRGQWCRITHELSCKRIKQKRERSELPQIAWQLQRSLGARRWTRDLLDRRLENRRLEAVLPSRCHELAIGGPPPVPTSNGESHDAIDAIPFHHKARIRRRLARAPMPRVAPSIRRGARTDIVRIPPRGRPHVGQLQAIRWRTVGSKHVTAGHPPCRFIRRTVASTRGGSAVLATRPEKRGPNNHVSDTHLAIPIC